MMKLFQELTSRRTAAAALAAGIGFLLVADTGVAGGDGTIGSLPSADGGDGSQTFYMSGPRDLVHDSIVDATGDGFYVAVDLPGDEVWIEFYGNVCLTLDERMLLQNSELDTGITAGFEGGGMLVVPEIGGELSAREIFVGVGLSLETPYNRIRSLVEQGLVLHTAQAVTRKRAAISYEAAGGLLKVCQVRKDRGR